MPKIEEPAGQAGTMTPPKPAPKAKKPKVPAPEREVVYDKVDVMLCAGDDALTAEMFMDLLGWETESETVKFGNAYDLVDHAGKKVRLTRNGNNRPWSESWSRQLAQDHLNRRWRLNGETVVVGRYAQMLSGQHRGIGLILASQMWADEGLPGNAHWRTLWPDGPPTMEGIVVFGVDESSETTRTLDNVKPRTLADVLYTSGLFANKKPEDREELSKMLERAVMILWDRTGEKANGTAPMRTHSEALSFIERHPTVIKCVKHIHEENSEGAVRTWIAPGTAAGLMYLMAASEADGDKYREEAPWTEKTLGKLDEYKRAEEFWTLLAGNNPDFAPCVETLGRIKDYATGCGGSIDERLALVLHAWTAYTNGTLADGVTIKYQADRNDDGNLVLDDFPTLTGIDLGWGAAESLKDTTNAGDPPDPSPEEIVERAKAEYANGLKAGPDEATYEKYAKANPNVILLWQTENTWNAYGEDARRVNQVTEKAAKLGKLRCGLAVAKFPLDDDAAYLPQLRARAARDYGADGKVATVILRDGKWVVVMTKSPVKSQTAPSTNGTAHHDEPAPAVEKPKPSPKAKGPKLKGGM